MHELSQRFMFEAAHTLHREFETESSRRVHGHTYYGEVTVAGIPDKRTGMIADLETLRISIEKVRDALDHRFLDEIPALGPPTLENLCSFIARNLSQEIDALVAVRVWREGSGDSCRLRVTRDLTGEMQRSR